MTSPRQRGQEQQQLIHHVQQQQQQQQQLQQQQQQQQQQQPFSTESPESTKKSKKIVKLPQRCVSLNSQPTFYIAGGNGTSLVEGPLLALGWKRSLDKQDERFRLKWADCKNSVNYNTFRPGEQMVNLIPNCKLLTNKLGLLTSLQEYERLTLLTKGRPPRLQMVDFFPETYKVDERGDRDKFLKEYKEGETWICKPVGMNQGKGIFLLRSRSDIDQLLVEREAKVSTTPATRMLMMRIVQSYISSPLLLEGRKFDLRSYLLIASTRPFCVLFHTGYVRLSCHKYSREDSNLVTHLTNQYIQKKDPLYQDTKEDTVWTMDKLNQYINQQVASSKGLEQDWVHRGLTKQMQRIALHCFHSVRHKLDAQLGYFQLFGLDFMIDSDMKVWLLEINTNPALHTNCEALKESIPCVVEGTLHLAIECFDKSRKGQPLLPLVNPGKFVLLYCAASPQGTSIRRSRSLSPYKEVTEARGRQTGVTSPYLRRWSPPGNLTGASPSPVSQAAAVAATAPRIASTQKKRVLVSSPLPTVNIGVSMAARSSIPREISANTVSPTKTSVPRESSPNPGTTLGVKSSTCKEHSGTPEAVTTATKYSSTPREFSVNLEVGQGTQVSIPRGHLEPLAALAVTREKSSTVVESVGSLQPEYCQPDEGQSRLKQRSVAPQSAQAARLTLMEAETGTSKFHEVISNSMKHGDTSHRGN